MKTTTIGAYPKPDDLVLPDWFNTKGSLNPADHTAALNALGSDAKAILDRASQEAVRDQVEAGIDVPTDGEVRRENYVHYHCRHLLGFSFENLRETETRGGAWRGILPTIVGPIQAGPAFLPEDWHAAQAATDRPVKITVPGPMTIADTVANSHYDDPRALGRDLSAALNVEIKRLAAAGCREIQVDEPVFARRPQDALTYGIEDLERCFHGLPGVVTRTVHACCGYPSYVDQEDYAKAPQESYFELSEALDEADFEALSLEDAHRHNDLSLLDRFARKTIVLGVIAIAKSRVESVEEIRGRLEAALGHIDRERLVAAPDCGLAHLTRDLAIQKLTALSQAARSL